MKNNLSRYVARVRAGETITLLDRNKPVARLIPIARVDRNVAVDARLLELERRGWLRRGTGSCRPWRDDGMPSRGWLARSPLRCASSLSDPRRHGLSALTTTCRSA